MTAVPDVAPAAETFPRGALVAVAALLAVTVGGAAVGRLARPPAPAAAPAVSAIDLRFADTPQGAIRVAEASSGRTVATLAPDSNGFVRGVMRGLARDRLSRGIGAAPAFRLGRDARGALWLQDLATGRRIDLEAFGAENRDAFAVMLPGGAAGRAHA